MQPQIPEPPMPGLFARDRLKYVDCKFRWYLAVVVTLVKLSES